MIQFFPFLSAPQFAGHVHPGPGGWKIQLVIYQMENHSGLDPIVQEPGT